MFESVKLSTKDTGVGGLSHGACLLPRVSMPLETRVINPPQHSKHHTKACLSSPI